MLTFISHARINNALRFTADLYQRAAGDAIRQVYNRSAPKEDQEELNGFTETDAPEIYNLQQIVAEMSRLRDNEQIFMEWLDHLIRFSDYTRLDEADKDIYRQIEASLQLYRSEKSEPA